MAVLRKERRCSGPCGESKLISEFYSFKSKPRYTQCKECCKSKFKVYWKGNRGSFLDRQRKNSEICRRKNYRKFFKYLLANPCVDCGETDVMVLDCDHVDGTKAFQITKDFARLDWKVIKKELRKCVVRCSNCHRKKTAKERNFARYRLFTRWLQEQESAV